MADYGGKKTIIVLTTINVPRVLQAYIENFRKHGRPCCEIVVIGDRKSPDETGPFVAALNSAGAKIDYWDVPRQQKWLADFPELDRLIPYNSIQRRNIGYLVAKQRGARTIIAVDDDNFPLHDDYLGAHSIVGDEAELETYSSDSGWLNPCGFLETDTNRRFYHRGYPLSLRWRDGKITKSRSKSRIVVNAGFWLKDADVDTITRMEEPFEVTGLKTEEKYFSVGRGTLSPFNSQNTAFHIDLLPCMYLIILRAAGRVAGPDLSNFRYDDIWMSYFCKKIIDHMGDGVSYGHPLVEQRRNPHDFVVDLQRELPGLVMTEKLVVDLAGVRLTERSYSACYAELTEGLGSRIAGNGSYTETELAYLDGMLKGMRTWLRTCGALSG